MVAAKMSIADEIAKAPSGARFVRADLHIHSFGASQDVIDHTFTPENIIQQAVRENLKLIAITDHNEVGNVAAAIGLAAGTNVTVIPASN
jgi:predicted metal-dependent phosphoesterase TrpH